MLSICPGSVLSSSALGSSGQGHVKSDVFCFFKSGYSVYYTHIELCFYVCISKTSQKDFVSRFVFNCMCASSGFPGRQINDACAISAQLSLILASSQFSSIQIQIKYISNLHEYKALKYISFKY